MELSDDSLSERPDDLSAREAELAVQQVVWTMQEGAGARAPVQFLVDGGPADTVLGIPTATPIKRKAPLQTLNLMSITSPAEGESVTSTFTASGANNGFESWVGWQLLKDGKVVKKGFGTARGWAANRLFPWKVKVDASGLPAGDYVLRLYNDDPTGGTEGSGPDEDTRTVVIT